MATMTLFGKTLNMLEQAMDLRSRHHNRLVSNIVNIDTPNYQPFETAIDDALARLDRPGGDAPLYRTDPGHLDADGNSGDKTPLDPQAPGRAAVRRIDNNGVSLESSMAELNENQIVYNAMAKIVGSKFGKLKNAIRGGQ